MTTAPIRAPSETPVPQARRGTAAARVTKLYLRSRRATVAVLALAVCGAVLRAAQNWHWVFNNGPRAQQIPMIIEAGAAVAIVVTTHSPFGEPERATGRRLPGLRLGTTLSLTGLAIVALQLAVTGASLNGGIFQLSRNIIGITGIGLLSSLATGGLLAWLPPLAYTAFTEYALLAAWNSPWTWPVRPPADRGAWICACLVYTTGLIAFTLRGARSRLTDST